MDYARGTSAYGGLIFTVLDEERSDYRLFMKPATYDSYGDTRWSNDFYEVKSAERMVSVYERVDE